MLNFITWDFNPVLLSWPVELRWYGLMFAIGFWLGMIVVGRMMRREGAPERWLSILLLWVALGTVVGARLGHVFFYEWDYYSQHPIEILYTRHGGLASHGGAIGVIVAVLLFSLLTSKRSPLWTFDRLVVATAMVAGLIRLGNLFNSEIFGHATTLPWGFMFVNSREWHSLYEGQACHPTQLYEAFCYFALFAVLMWMYWRRNSGERPGLLFGTFLIGVFSARFLIEFVKNNQVDFEQDMLLNMGQCLSIPFILAGVFFVVRALRRPRVHIDYPNKFPDRPEGKKK